MVYLSWIMGKVSDKRTARALRASLADLRMRLGGTLPVVHTNPPKTPEPKPEYPGPFFNRIAGENEYSIGFVVMGSSRDSLTSIVFGLKRDPMEAALRPMIMIYIAKQCAER